MSEARRFRAPGGGQDPPFASLGPVETAVRDLVRSRAGGTGGLAVGFAPRSPLGPHAIKILIGEQGGETATRCREFARWLDRQAWVEAVAPRPPNVYLRLPTDTIRDFVVSAYTEPASPPGESGEGCGHIGIVRSPAPSGQRARLAEERARVLASAAAALLVARGFAVVHDHVPVAAEPSESTPAWARADAERLARDPGGRVIHIFPREEASGPSGHPMAAAFGTTGWAGRLEIMAVGPVDVPNGPLRARHGGMLYAGDLHSELRAWVAAWCRPGPQGTREADFDEWREHYATALLRLILLRTERTGHITLEAPKLRTEHAAAFAALMEARLLADEAPAAEPGGAPEPNRALRALLLHLDALPAAVARSATRLEPAYLIRYGDGLADRARACRGQLPPGDPVWSASGAAIDRVCALTAIELPEPLRLARELAYED